MVWKDGHFFLHSTCDFLEPKILSISFVSFYKSSLSLWQLEGITFTQHSKGLPTSWSWHCSLECEKNSICCDYAPRIPWPTNGRYVLTNEMEHSNIYIYSHHIMFFGQWSQLRSTQLLGLLQINHFSLIPLPPNYPRDRNIQTLGIGRPSVKVLKVDKTLIW